MLLSDYVWSRNPRGIHSPRVYYQLGRERYLNTDMGWYKFNVAEAESLADCAWCLQNNITPIVRIYRDRPGAMPVDQTLVRLWRAYFDAGVRWFEFYNEPNIGYPEWPDGVWVHHRNAQIIRDLCENWLVFAETIIGWGGYPAFPALTEGANDAASATLWLDAMLRYLRTNHYERFVNIINNGLWFATHPYTLNHFYQEVPGQPATPRLPAQYNAQEGGWHFEYPYDPLSQRLDPGRTVWGGTPQTPFGDPSGITAMGIAFQQRLAQWFESGVVPVVGTEGGVHPIPYTGPVQTDVRYPAYNMEQHGIATAAMFNWIAQQGPPWFFGICLWKEDEYFDNGLPAIGRMIETPQLRKNVPPMSSGREEVVRDVPIDVRGPGPVHAQPDIHMIILAPGLDPAWFFETAREYWQQFRPTVTTLTDFINFFPYSKSLATTVIARQDTAQLAIQAIRDQYPLILFDLIIAEGDDLSTVADIFRARVRLNSRFG